MKPLRCFTCGHVLAHLELEYEETIIEIDNNIKLKPEQKIEEKRKLIDKLFPGRWKNRYCCRARFISSINLIDLIL